MTRLADNLGKQEQAIRVLSLLLGPALKATAALITTDADNPSTVDGYPSSSGAAGSGGGNSELTTVEAATVARTRSPQPDPVHTLAQRAVEARRSVLNALRDLTAIEGAWNALRTPPTAKDLGNDTWCAHARHLGLPYDPDWDTYRTSDLWGLWPEPRPACRWVWDFARITRTLPTLEQMQARQRGERVMIPAALKPTRTRTERGTDVETVAQMAERFGSAG